MAEGRVRHERNVRQLTNVVDRSKFAFIGIMVESDAENKTKCYSSRGKCGQENWTKGKMKISEIYVYKM